VHLTRLALTDFRSYADVDVLLAPGVTIFSGPNGEGKTNLVEAVGYAAALASHRAAQDAPLIRKGADQAIIRTAISTASNDALVEIELNAGRANRVRLNRTPLTRPRDVLGVLRTVLFAPEDLALVKGDPGDRRRFLDDLLVAMAPRYAAVRADYDRVLKQRTALLKSAGPKGGPKGNRESREAVTATLDVWDAHLARTGAELLVAREHLVTALRPHVEKSYAAVAGDGRGPAAIEYKRSFESPPPDQVGPVLASTGQAGKDEAGTTHGERVRAAEQALRAALLEVRASELDRGVCLAGPHRDELELSVRGLPARGAADEDGDLDDEDPEGRRRAARRRGDREADQAADEGPLAAEDVGDPPAEQEQRAEGQRVGGDDPLPGAFREAERFLGRGQGDVDNRRVEHDHQLGEREDDQDQPAFVPGLGGGCHRGRV